MMYVQCAGSGKISNNYRVTRHFGPIFPNPVHMHMRHFRFVRQIVKLDVKDGRFKEVEE